MLNAVEIGKESGALGGGRREDRIKLGFIKKVTVNFKGCNFLICPW